MNNYSLWKLVKLGTRFHKLFYSVHTICASIMILFDRLKWNTLFLISLDIVN